MYFPDLSQYQYGNVPIDPHAINIGWLSKEHPFPVGTVSDAFVEQLTLLVAEPVNEYRGIHLCEFCPPPPQRLTEKGLRVIDPLPGTYGNGEVRIQSANQSIYVAPVLVLHYVVAHGYFPPVGFIQAVEALSGNQGPTSASTGSARKAAHSG